MAIEALRTSHRFCRSLRLPALAFVSLLALELVPRRISRIQGGSRAKPRYRLFSTFKSYDKPANRLRRLRGGLDFIGNNWKGGGGNEEAKEESDDSNKDFEETLLQQFKDIPEGVRELMDQKKAGEDDIPQPLDPNSPWNADVAVIKDNKVDGWAPCKVIRVDSLTGNIDVEAEGGYRARNISAKFVVRRGFKNETGKESRALEIEQNILDEEWMKQFKDMDHDEMLNFEYMPRIIARKERNKKERRPKAFKYRHVELEFEAKPLGIKVISNRVVGIKKKSQAYLAGVRPGWQLLYVSDHKVPQETERVSRLLDAAVTTGFNFTIYFERRRLPDGMLAIEDSSEGRDEYEVQKEIKMKELYEGFSQTFDTALINQQAEMLREKEKRKKAAQMSPLSLRKATPVPMSSMDLKAGQTVRISAPIYETDASDIEAGEVGVIEEIDGEGIWMNIPKHESLRLVRDRSIIDGMDIHRDPRGFNTEVMITRDSHHVGWRPCYTTTKHTDGSVDVIDSNGITLTNVPPLYIRHMEYRISPRGVYDSEVAVMRKGDLVGWATCRIDNDRNDGTYDITTLENKEKIFRVHRTQLRKLLGRGVKPKEHRDPEHLVVLSKLVTAALDKLDPDPEDEDSVMRYQSSIYLDVPATEGLAQLADQSESFLKTLTPPTLHSEEPDPKYENSPKEKRLRIPLTPSFLLTELNRDTFLKITKKAMYTGKKFTINLAGLYLQEDLTNRKECTGGSVSIKCVEDEGSDCFMLKKIRHSAKLIVDKFIPPERQKPENIGFLRLASVNSPSVFEAHPPGPISNPLYFNPSLSQSAHTVRISTLTVGVGKKKYLIKLKD